MNNYQRDGFMCPHQQGMKNYGTYDNTGFDHHDNHPTAELSFKEPPLQLSTAVLDAYEHREGSDDYTQAGDLFRLFNPAQQQRLAENVADSLSAARADIQQAMLVHFEAMDQQCAELIKIALAAK